MNSLPLREDAPPTRTHCVCMSGLTDAQVKLATLYGALQVVEWLAVAAQQAVAGPAPEGKPELHEQLLKLQLGLVRHRALCLEHAFPGAGP